MVKLFPLTSCDWSRFVAHFQCEFAVKAPGFGDRRPKAMLEDCLS